MFWPIPGLMNKLYCVNASWGIVYTYVTEMREMCFFFVVVVFFFALWKTLQRIRLGLASYEHT